MSKEFVIMKLFVKKSIYLFIVFDINPAIDGKSIKSKALSSELKCSKLIPFEFHAFLCNAHFLEFRELFALKKRASEKQ